jgi:tetratricopeptide (TPR) repeat protein
LPAGLIDVIRRCLAKPVEERYASATQLADALRVVREERASGSAETAAQVARRRRARRAAPWVVGVVVVSVVALVAIRLSTRPTLAFASRDQILIADVDNQTDDEVFDTALRTALEYDLQQSPYAIVLDRNRIARTLELMRRDPASRIDEELGREICLFTGVKALVLPRILAAGEAYDLQAILIEPESGAHVDRIRVTARGKEDVLLNAVDDLTSGVRTRLGESLASIEDTDQQVSDVTTSSWEALRSLTLGHQHWRRSEYAEAADLFEDALEHDPDFVTARGSLGLLYLQFLGRAEEGKRLLREALGDADGVSKRERLMLQAVNHEFVEGDLGRALSDYDLILDLYPDSAAALNNRGKVLEKLGRFDEAVAEFEKMLEVDPRAQLALNSIWWNHMYYRRQPADAENVALRMIAESPEDPMARFRLGWTRVAQRRFAEAEEPLRRAVEIDPLHPYALPNLAHVLLANGSHEEAIPIYRQVRELILEERVGIRLPELDSHLALALRAVGRNEEAGQVLQTNLEQHRELEERPVWRLVYMAYLEACLGNHEGGGIVDPRGGRGRATRGGPVDRRRLRRGGRPRADEPPGRSDRVAVAVLPGRLFVDLLPARRSAFRIAAGRPEIGAARPDGTTLTTMQATVSRDVNEGGKLSIIRSGRSRGIH